MTHIWEPDNRTLKAGDFSGQLAPPSDLAFQVWDGDGQVELKVYQVH